MATPKQIRRLATDPVAHMRFAVTGRLPEIVRPQSPLITLLERLSPQDRSTIVGVLVTPDLGYIAPGLRMNNAEQLLRWIKPSPEQFVDRPTPAESRRIKAFNGPLYLDDLLACATRYPQNLKTRYPGLTRPMAASNPAASHDAPQADDAGAQGPEPVPSRDRNAG